MDESGRFFWAIFEDGLRAALLPEAELMGVAYADPRAFGLVVSNGSGGRDLNLRVRVTVNLGGDPDLQPHRALGD